MRVGSHAILLGCIFDRFSKKVMYLITVKTLSKHSSIINFFSVEFKMPAVKIQECQLS